MSSLFIPATLTQEQINHARIFMFLEQDFFKIIGSIWIDLSLIKYALGLLVVSICFNIYLHFKILGSIPGSNIMILLISTFFA